MITTVNSPNLGSQIFLRAFGCLLARKHGTELAFEGASHEIFSNIHQISRSKYIAPGIVIDGDWPRIRQLNRPLPPNFFNHPFHCNVILAGEFRQWQFYLPNREFIRNEVLNLPSSMGSGRDVVVLARTFRQMSKTKKFHFVLRPTLQELKRILPRHTPAQTTILIAHGNCCNTELWRNAGYSIKHVNETEVLEHTQNAKFIVNDQSSLHWWAGFLSHAIKVTMLTFGKYCSACAKNQTNQLGARKLLYKDSRTDWVALPQTPET